MSRVALWLCCYLGCVCGTAAEEPPAPAAGPEPTLSIPKATYVLGEAITFLAGVRSKTPMSPESFEPCDVEIVDPDHQVSASRVTWPADGDGSYGWSGGRTIAPDESILGEYAVRVTCGDKTIEGGFTVEHAPVIEDVEARFDFAPGCGDRPSDTTVTLVVVNHSYQRVTVSRPGALMANDIWFHSRRNDPPAMCDAFFPVEALGFAPISTGDVLIESMTHDSLEDADHFVLAPGDSLRLPFCLSAGKQFCSHFWPPSWIRVVTAQQVLIGAPDGPFSRFGPLRLMIEGEYELLAR